MKFYFPGESADYPYVEVRRLEVLPPLGATIKINRSDNADITPGTFKVVDITYSFEIVNKTMAKDSSFIGPVVTLERIS